MCQPTELGEHLLNKSNSFLLCGGLGLLNRLLQFLLNGNAKIAVNLFGRGSKRTCDAADALALRMQKFRLGRL